MGRLTVSHVSRWPPTKHRNCKTKHVKLIVMFTAPALKWYVTSNTHNPSYLSRQVLKRPCCIPNSIIFMHNYILGGELEPPTAILWVYHFLAQHFDYLRDSKRAMEYINKALEHTPTLIEAYMVKARIYKVLPFFPAYSVPKRLVEPELQPWAYLNHVNPVSGIYLGNITLLTSGQACNTYHIFTNGREG